jgi:hypothetical protein
MSGADMSAPLIAGTPGKPVSAFRQQYRGRLSQSVVNHPVSATHVTAHARYARSYRSVGWLSLARLNSHYASGAEEMLGDRGGPPAGVLAEVTEISGLRRQPGSRRAYQRSAVRWNNMARSSSEKAEKIAS